MAWVLLIIAGLLETVWAASMKLSEGFTRPLPSAVTAVAAAASFWLLALAMRGLPLGVAYPVWVGIGAVGSVAVGAVLLGEGVNALRMFSVALIVAGIAGLSLAEARSA
jgi:quaternary ammonium compound-resistance protein SugE